jgi:hypothetical protein
MRFVGVMAGEATERGLTLNVDKRSVVLDIEQGLGGIHDAPDNHGSNLNGIAVGIIYLELRTLEIIDLQRDLLLAGEGIGEPESAFPDGANELSKKGQHPRFIRGQRQKFLSATAVRLQQRRGS